MTAFFWLWSWVFSALVLFVAAAACRLIGAALLFVRLSLLPDARMQLTPQNELAAFLDPCIECSRLLLGKSQGWYPHPNLTRVREGTPGFHRFQCERCTTLLLRNVLEGTWY